MLTAAELAGFFAAHAVWCISDGDTLTPMLAYTTERGERNLIRLAGNELSECVEIGRQKLGVNEMDANDAVLVFDGRITLSNEKVDALILELRTYFSPGSEAMIAVPYTPKNGGAFRVHKPKLVSWENCDDFDVDAVFEAFFAGVAAHEKGAQIWNSALDESK